MSAEHQGPAGGRKPEGGKKPAAKPPRVGSSLTDAVVAALAKVDEKKPDGAASEPPPAAEAGCAATATAAKEPPPTVGAAAPPPVVAGPPAVAGPPLVSAAQDGAAHGPNGFRSGPGSFHDLTRRWWGAAPMAVPVAAPVAAPQAQPAPAQAPATVEPVRSSIPSPSATETAAVGGAAAEPAEVRRSDPPVTAPEPPKPVAAPSPPAVAAPEPGKPVRVRYFGRTDVGLVREHNEDNFLVADLAAGKRGVDAPREVTIADRGCIFAVCDGMGGAAAGEVASQMAVDTIHEVFSQGGPTGDRDAFARRLVRSIEEAGHRIFSAAKMDRSRRGMGTTTTLAGLVDNVLFVGQVGDSRAYILRAAQLEQVTKDQSLVNQLIEAGQLTEEEAEAFEHSNIILQALGTTEEVTVDLTFLELRRGDRLLLCSDGLSGLVHSEMIRDVLAGSEGLDEAAAKLIQMANAGGGHDNITVILAEFDGEGLKAPENVRALYQQYPLPPDDTMRGQALTPRDTAIKSGGPKPGADVKRDDSGHPTEAAAPQGGSKTWLIAIALLLVIGLVAGAYVVFTQMGSTTDTGHVEPSTPPPPPEPQGDVQPPVVEPPPEPVQPAEPARGTVRVSTDVEDGTLFVNGESRGPLSDGMTLELAPGVYTVEARSGDAQVATQSVTVTEGGEAAVTLNEPAVPEPTEPPPQQPPQQHHTRPQGPNQPGGPQVRPLRPNRPERPGGALPSNPF